MNNTALSDFNAALAIDHEEDNSLANASTFPLSFAQQRFWFLCQFDPESPLYNIVTSARLRGDLKTGPLRDAINEMVRRHESLRTTFTVVDRTPMQVISSARSLDFPVIDLTRLSHNEREVETRRLLDGETKQPFDLRRDSMLRVQLLRLSETEHILSLNTHHIVSDAWSMTVFLNELATLYEDFSNGRPSSLADVPIQYADFAVWQRNLLEGEILEKQLEYWNTKLTGAPALLEFPLDYPRPAAQSPRGAEVFFSFSRCLSESLKAFSQKEGCTLFMTLLAAFKTLAARYTGESDIVIGTPIGNRDEPELESVIGCFINTLALRTDLSGNPTFRELLERVRDTALDAYDHQDTPLERIVEKLNVPRHPGRNPLFQVLFQYLAEPPKMQTFGDLTIEMLRPETGTAKFDLVLSFEEGLDGLVGSFEYSTELFNSDTIHRMVGHYRTLLEAIICDSNQRIGSLPLLTEQEERDLVQHQPAPVFAPEELTVPALFEQQTKATPDAVAVVFEDQKLTYAELNERANQLARYLSKLGVGPEKLVAVCMERSLEMIIAVLGICKAGGAYVPLDPDYPKDRLQFMLDDTDATIVLTQQWLGEIIPVGQNTRVICLDSGWNLIAKESKRNSVSTVRPENLAYIIYTSGSTGRPKGVMISHESLCHHTAWMQKSFPLNGHDRVLQRAPFSFDVSVWEIFGPLLNGAQLIIAAPGVHRDSAALAKLIAEQNITILQIVPSQLQVLLDEPELKKCRALKYVLAGAEVLPRDLIRRFHSVLDAQLFNTYGPTENTIDATCYACSAEDADKPSVPIGKPIAHTLAYVLDTNLQLMPVGVPGELHLAGTGLARGYWRRPELTAQKFIHHSFNGNGKTRLYKTGDRVRYLPDGNIEFLGRIDHQVKIRGFRIEPAEIETAMCTHSEVREAVVMAREDGSGEKRLVAYLVAPNTSANISDNLRAHLKAILPEYMIPSAFVRLESLPLTPNGKIDLKALPSPEFKSDDSTFVAPRTSSEQQLAKIWCDVLGLKQVGVHDNFFELGGHSLLATQVVARMRSVSGKDVSLREFFQSPTVAGLGTITGKNSVQNVNPATDLIIPLPRKKLGERIQQSAHAIIISLQAAWAEIYNFMPESTFVCIAAF